VGDSRYRVLLVSSSGGVLLDLLALRPWWYRHYVSWIAVQAPDTTALLKDQRVRWEREQSAGRCPCWPPSSAHCGSCALSIRT
jgi:hypothetical protein